MHNINMLTCPVYNANIKLKYEDTKSLAGRAERGMTLVGFQLERPSDTF